LDPLPGLGFIVDLDPVVAWIQKTNPDPLLKSNGDSALISTIEDETYRIVESMYIIC